MMKKMIKIIGFILASFVLIIAIALFYLKLGLPNAGQIENLVGEKSVNNIEHGEYLANHVMVCMDCHSQRDWSRFSGPLVPGTLGAGGEVFNQDFGFPGSYVAPNITPYHLSSWTDGEIFHAITTGINKDGKALFPVMPYIHYGNIDRKDIEDIIAYIRTIPSVKKDHPESVSDFPMSFIINTIPQKANFTQKPDKTNTVEYGKYLVKAAACMDCHTRQEKGEFVGEYLAGGMEFKFPDQSVLRSANITPDSETGIGKWTEKEFIQRFKMYADSNYSLPIVEQGNFQTFMPWAMYAGMKVEDLKAMYAYLQTVEAVNNKVLVFSSSKK